MARNDIQKLILSEIQEVKSDMKEVRQKDIPYIHEVVAGLRKEVEHVKEKASTKSMIITGVGGLLAVATSMAVAYFK